MADLISPFTAKPHPPAKSGADIMTMMPLATRELVEAQGLGLSASAADDAKLAAWAKIKPLAVGQFQITDMIRVARLDSARWMLEAARAFGGDLSDSQDLTLLRSLSAALTGTNLRPVDMSHGRASFRLTGPKAPTVLNKLIAIDLSEAVFPAGRVAEAPIHRVGVTLYRVDALTFDVMTLSSYADDVFATVEDACIEFGVQVGQAVTGL